MNYYSYHIGPFLKCYYHMSKIEMGYIGCKKCKTKFVNDNFCSHCGTEIKSYKIIEMCQNISWSLIDELDENAFFSTGEISHDGYEILLSNYKMPFREDSVEYMKNVQEINTEQIKKETIWFKGYHKDDISILEKYYDKVEICWGVVKTYNL